MRNNKVVMDIIFSVPVIGFVSFSFCILLLVEGFSWYFVKSRSGWLLPLSSLIGGVLSGALLSAYAQTVMAWFGIVVFIGVVASTALILALWISRIKDLKRFQLFASDLWIKKMIIYLGAHIFCTGYLISFMISSWTV